jgi:hypothetical protein
MTQKFVRYSPDVEQEEPDFELTLQAVLDDMKQHMRGSLKTEGIGLVVRNAHAKGYGLARGEFEILSGVPNEYAQGIFLRWVGTMDGHKIESWEVIVDNEQGLIVERTIAMRPYPALKLFRDAMYAALKDKLPPDVWDYSTP